MVFQIAAVAEEPEFTEIIENVNFFKFTAINLFFNRFMALSKIKKTFLIFYDLYFLTDVFRKVTVPAGRNVRMACSVKNLGTFKVTVIFIHNFHPISIPAKSYFYSFPFYHSIEMFHYFAKKSENLEP